MTNAAVFGRPVEGDISYGETMRDQHDPQLFLDALDKLLAHEEVEYAQWIQYTPYFNDGDACIFGTHMEYGGGVKLTFSDNGEEYGGEAGPLFSSFQKYVPADPANGKRWGSYEEVDEIDGVDITHIRPDLEDFRSIVENGHHVVFLQKSFGDHATVRATKEGFSVDYYDHD